MLGEINKLNPYSQKMIDLGIIDSWLRGICGIVPHCSKPHGFNKHLLACETDTIHQDDIIVMTGFRQLIAACSHSDICIEFGFLPDGHIGVEFTPEKNFMHSTIFGASYTNVVPALLGGRK